MCVIGKKCVMPGIVSIGLFLAMTHHDAYVQLDRRIDGERFSSTTKGKCVMCVIDYFAASASSCVIDCTAAKTGASSRTAILIAAESTAESHV
jgi:hypothetical protein